MKYLVNVTAIFCREDGSQETRMLTKEFCNKERYEGYVETFKDLSHGLISVNTVVYRDLTVTSFIEVNK